MSQFGIIVEGSRRIRLYDTKAEAFQAAEEAQVGCKVVEVPDLPAIETFKALPPEMLGVRAGFAGLKMSDEITRADKRWKPTSHLTETGQDGLNWDPVINERTYYRSTSNGDRGWMVRRDGKDCIKLDRPMQDIVRPFKESEWSREKESWPMTDMDKARICFAADKELCKAVGIFTGSRVTWLDLTDEKRAEWATKGPEKPDIRIKLHAMIMECLREL